MNKGWYIAIMSIRHQRRTTLWAKLGGYVCIVLATRNAKLGKSLKPSSLRQAWAPQWDVILNKTK